MVGASRASGWSSASQINIAALSVINSPPGKTSAGTWRIGLIAASAGSPASSVRIELSTTRYGRSSSVNAASTITDPDPLAPWTTYSLMRAPQQSAHPGARRDPGRKTLQAREPGRSRARFWQKAFNAESAENPQSHAEARLRRADNRLAPEPQAKL